MDAVSRRSAEDVVDGGYAWVMLALGTVLVALNLGALSSLSVFLKPLSAEFGWARGATALSYTTAAVTIGVAGVFWGRVADRYGGAKHAADAADDFRVGPLAVAPSFASNPAPPLHRSPMSEAPRSRADARASRAATKRRVALVLLAMVVVTSLFVGWWESRSQQHEPPEPRAPSTTASSIGHESQLSEATSERLW